MSRARTGGWSATGRGRGRALLGGGVPDGMGGLAGVNGRLVGDGPGPGPGAAWRWCARRNGPCRGRQRAVGRRRAGAGAGRCSAVVCPTERAGFCPRFSGGLAGGAKGGPEWSGPGWFLPTLLGSGAGGWRSVDSFAGGGRCRRGAMPAGGATALVSARWPTGPAGAGGWQPAAGRGGRDGIRPRALWTRCRRTTPAVMQRPNRAHEQAAVGSGVWARPDSEADARRASALIAAAATALPPRGPTLVIVTSRSEESHRAALVSAAPT